MSYYSTYRWCAVPYCKNTSVKTPDKLWIQVPNNMKMRKTWFKVAKRDPEQLTAKTRLYFCEDHFDLEHDMENYVQYKIMGSVKRIRLKSHSIPSRFDWNGNDKSASNKSHLAEDKMLGISVSKDSVQDHIEKDSEKESSSCIEDSQAVLNVPTMENKQVQNSVKIKDEITSPTKPIATKPSTSQSMPSQKSYPPPLLRSVVDHNYLQSKASLSKTSSDTSLQAENKMLQIKNKPSLYIAISENHYFLIDFIRKHTDISKQNVILCLMKIMSNRSFAQLAHDFGLSETQASCIFFNNMPGIVRVILPFIKQFSTELIKNNLPIAFRQKYNQVTCIIDCLEIEIEKPTKAIHQALTWSENKKTNTIKYLISCTPDGLVNFVSDGYAGRINEVNLVKHSGFLECLQPGSCILADKEFEDLELYLYEKGFVLLRTPCVPTGIKLSKTEVKQTKEIANLKIHMERVIRTLRKFSMLQLHSVINWDLIGMLDLCMKTACAIINIQDSLINEF